MNLTEMLMTYHTMLLELGGHSFQFRLTNNSALVAYGIRETTDTLELEVTAEEYASLLEAGFGEVVNKGQVGISVDQGIVVYPTNELDMEGLWRGCFFTIYPSELMDKLRCGLVKTDILSELEAYTKEQQ